MHEFKGDYALHSQSIQALAQKLEANVQGTRERRSNGDMDIEYPYRPKEYQTVTWKDQGIRVHEGWIILSNGRGREPLVLLLPEEYRSADIRKAELLWRADHYELALTLDTGVSNPPLLRRVMTAGVDLGEVNIAAAVAENGQGVVINQAFHGRQAAAVIPTGSIIPRAQNGDRGSDPEHEAADEAVLPDRSSACKRLHAALHGVHNESGRTVN